MNWKNWFYVMSICLLMLTTTVFVITTDGNSWEDFKGRSGSNDDPDCVYRAEPPKDAPNPPNCAWFFGCEDKVTHGTDGECKTTYYDGRKFKDNIDVERIVKKTRKCTTKRKIGPIPLPECKMVGDTVEKKKGPLNKCVLSAC